MKKSVFTIILIILFTYAEAQVNRRIDPATGRDQFGNQVDPSTQPDNLDDSTNTEIQSLPPKLYMWKLEGSLGNQVRIPVDTLKLNFQNSNLPEGMNGEYNFLGNLGSPRMSRIFFNRNNQAHTLFLNPLNSFYFRPEDINYTNSNIPYTNLTYYKAGNKVNGEERFKSYFSVNVNKPLAFGFNVDYLYGRGYYQNQSTSYFNAGLFGSYVGERYQAHMSYNAFNMRMNENGGIADDRYITRPEEMAEGGKTFNSTNMPVKLEQTANRNKNFHVYLTHRYRLGFFRESIQLEDKADAKPGLQKAIGTDSLKVELPKDTMIVKEFVPVTSFIHTLKVERSRRRFRAGTEPEGFYPETAALQTGQSNDSTTALSVTNTFGIALLEGFNKYAKAGLTAYVKHNMSRYELMNTAAGLKTRPSLTYKEQELYLGGELAKREGHTLHYNVTGEVGMIDKAIGQFNVNGSADLNFRLWGDTVNFIARGYVKNTLPSFYLRHYHSNHYNWDNDFDKEFRTRIEGELNIDRWRTNLRVGVENLKNYAYLGPDAIPLQDGGNIQVLSAQLKQNFKLGIFHLDNEVTWQKSSNQSILPLPDLSLYHNFYLLTAIAKKVLTVQLGAEVVYFTKYHAPAYSPGIQQFHLQPTADQVELGGYPFVNIYANLHLKRTRIFVMSTHITQGIGNAMSFTVPHYPVNPTQWLRLGVSWNFYD